MANLFEKIIQIWSFSVVWQIWLKVIDQKSYIQRPKVLTLHVGGHSGYHKHESLAIKIAKACNLTGTNRLYIVTDTYVYYSKIAIVKNVITYISALFIAEY